MIKGFISLYVPGYAAALVYMLQSCKYKAGPYLAQYWRTTNFNQVVEGVTLEQDRAANRLLLVLRTGMILQIAAGLTLIYLGLWRHVTGGVAFGAAVIVAYPVVWAHLAVVPQLCSTLFRALFRPKRVGKAILCFFLERQVRQLRARHDFQVIAVVGSVGKTSTKIAIAKVLGANQKVLYQEGNYNDRLTVPLVFFNHQLPGLFNLLAWLKILAANRRIMRQKYPYKYVVVELGTDGPGQIARFAYLKPELSVVTAVAAEHMEFFGTLDAVAAEELSVCDFSAKALINCDDVSDVYLGHRAFLGYGVATKPGYRVTSWRQKDLQHAEITFKFQQEKALKASVNVLGAQGVKIALAAASVAHALDCTREATVEGLQAITPFAGRMQVLEGSKQAIIIDDTYNASPVAVMAALDVLYAAKTSCRIAILGSMNELGNYSREAHCEVGAYCNAAKLDWVVTIGLDAERYLAPAALEAGCRVKSFMSPYEAGEFVKKQLVAKAIVLAEGSQNGVFAEEALKALLLRPSDAEKLVRQSPSWLAIKQRQFPPQR